MTLCVMGDFESFELEEIFFGISTEDSELVDVTETFLVGSVVPMESNESMAEDLINLGLVSVKDLSSSSEEESSPVSDLTTAGVHIWTS